MQRLSTSMSGGAVRSLRNRLNAGWRRLNGSLWFVPGCIAGGAAVLALVMLELSEPPGTELAKAFPRTALGWAAEGSRSMLATIAGSIVTVAGVTFSVMVVAVAQASAQFTPRVLRNFMRDRHSQVALGVLAGVFVYALIVLRTIRGEGEQQFVPGPAVTVALLLAIIGVGFLVYFIHHIASTLDPGRILASVHDETVEAIDKLFPQTLGARAPAASVAKASYRLDQRTWRTLGSRRTGYIQYIDEDGLLEFAREHDAVVRMERAVGQFVTHGAALASFSSADASADEDDLAREIGRHYVVDSYRTVHQDVGFGVRQMVDVALKALSPGVNDPTTAVSCIHYLTGVLSSLAARRIPSPYREVDGELRVVALGVQFDELLHEAFDEIRRSASENARIQLRLLDALEWIAAAAPHDQRRKAVLQQIDLVEEVAHKQPIESERDALRAACKRARGRLAQFETYT
ncbi:MAG: DUF2254 domain-containing protein [Steroidobacteraceae bacterium]|nr:DUF2254 domain-containing protein [Steroidobacteraceae bacterium]